MRTVRLTYKYMDNTGRQLAYMKDYDGPYALVNPDGSLIIIPAILIFKDGYMVQHNPNFAGDYRYTVYKHTCRINDKVYFGITRNTPEYRWGVNGSGYKDQRIGEDIKKYGWDAFDHEILHKNVSLEEAATLERLYIDKYRSYDSRFGYNETKGGETGDIEREALRKPVCVYKGKGDKLHLEGEYPSVSATEKATKVSSFAISERCKANRTGIHQRYRDYLFVYKEYQEVAEAELEWFKWQEQEQIDSKPKRSTKKSKKKKTSKMYTNVMPKKK